MKFGGSPTQYIDSFHMQSTLKPHNVCVLTQMQPTLMFAHSAVLLSEHLDACDSHVGSCDSPWKLKILQLLFLLMDCQRFL